MFAVLFLHVILGKFERSNCTMGVHITHNGDFDEMEAYQQVQFCLSSYMHLFLNVGECATCENVNLLF